MKHEELATIAALIREQRQAALGTLHEQAPFVSMVAYAAEADFGGVLLHLSRLAPHTKHLLAAPAASLLICESDDGRDDVQTLARITLMGEATPLDAASTEFAPARAWYLARLPAAEMLFSFPDFLLFRFVPREARYVGGFARAYTLTPNQLRSAAQILATEDTESTEI
jgi:putative heme iron utilization protein